MNIFTQRALKVVLAGLILFVSSPSSFGQSESNNPVTYDTTITEKYLSYAANTWNVRITRQKSDASKRPVLFTILGSGEVGTNPSKMLVYGPHYWLANGWDGSVKLGNGAHYPILVTIQQPKPNMRPWDLKLVFEAILKALPIKLNSVHVSGLSEGSYEWGELISYSASTGDHSTMSEIKSWVDLEGVGPADNFSGFNLTFPQAFGYWAKNYGGKFFGLEGALDDRQLWSIAGNMNAGSANSAFFSYEKIGGGGHCCWNSMYDPSVTNWSKTNPNIAVNTLHPNTEGTYHAGSNIFQWMLRQGDTTLVPSSASAVQPAVETSATLPSASAGSAQSITLPLNTVTLSGTATAASGTTLSTETWAQTSGPSTASISTPNALKSTATGLVPGTYIFSLTVKNSLGQTTSSNVTVNVVLVPGTAPALNAGTALSITLPINSVTLSGKATAASGTSLASETWAQASGPSASKVTTPNA
jgi:hypothetical protein